ncbi:MAG: hypothetical protein IT178_09335 [Acidobacteria bacterium]|nr:hypothetical protein [Acidobacteriota bacterium]
MAQSVHQLEERIADARSRLGADLRQLEAKVADATNWRTHYNRAPFLWLGLAMAVGFIASGSTGGGTGRMSRALRAQTGTDTFDRFVGAFTSLAVDRAKVYLDERLPGFSRAFDRG